MFVLKQSTRICERVTLKRLQKCLSIAERTHELEQFVDVCVRLGGSFDVQKSIVIRVLGCLLHENVHKMLAKIV